MKGKVRLLMVLLAVAPTVVLILAVLMARSHMPGRGRGGTLVGPVPPPPTYQAKRIARWKSQEFVSLTNGVDLQEVISGFNYSFNEFLNEEEKQSLTNAVINLIGAFQGGTFEDYTRFRIPVKNFHFATAVSNAMQQRFSVPPGTIRDNPEMAWKQYWNVVINNRYSNYWVGVSLSNSELQVEKSLCPTNDLVYSLTRGSSIFTVDSVVNLELFAKQVLTPEGSGKIAAYVKAQLSPSTVELLSQYQKGRGDEEVRAAVIKDLNRFIQTGPIYDQSRFGNVKLSARTLNLMNQNPSGAALVRLNRLLLVDAFPHALAPTTWVENVGMSFGRPCIVLEPSREQVFKSNGFVKIATIRILAKPRDNDPIYPIYVRWYWSPEDRQWLPEQLVAMYSRPDKHINLFF